MLKKPNIYMLSFKGFHRVRIYNQNWEKVPKRWCVCVFVESPSASCLLQQTRDLNPCKIFLGLFSEGALNKGLFGYTFHVKKIIYIVNLFHIVFICFGDFIYCPSQ